MALRVEARRELQRGHEIGSLSTAMRCNGGWPAPNLILIARNGFADQGCTVQFAKIFDVRGDGAGVVRVHTLRSVRVHLGICAQPGMTKRWAPTAFTSAIIRPKVSAYRA